ncbi:MAG: hypothetical protein EZS28_051327 [Streblomastix strix]|uniref:Uncharacterized protein n=1 Tax=Streblomastix strix TaxID=222440 RepID=A0A5J4T4I7_9EUKA|nr:MAG: hypothetical protein EZS28_051327 [Streblomastix strix]
MKTNATTTAAAAAATLFLFRFFLKELLFLSLSFQSFPNIYCMFLHSFIYPDRFIPPGLIVRALRLVFL